MRGEACASDVFQCSNYSRTQHATQTIDISPHISPPTHSPQHTVVHHTPQTHTTLTHHTIISPPPHTHLGRVPRVGGEHCLGWVESIQRKRRQLRHTRERRPVVSAAPYPAVVAVIEMGLGGSVCEGCEGCVYVCEGGGGCIVCSLCVSVEDSVWRIQRQDWGGDAGKYSRVHLISIQCSEFSMQYAVFSVCTWAEMRISEGETSRIPVT